MNMNKESILKKNIKINLNKQMTLNLVINEVSTNISSIEGEKMLFVN